MTISPPPVFNPLSEQDGKATLPWTLFFNSVYDGDAGDAWEPTFTNLAVVGSPTITGRYYKISNYLVFFSIVITPTTSTTATAGTTYMDNFPLSFTGDGVVFAVSGGLGTNSGHVDAGTNRVYVPAWADVTVPLTLIGICEAR